MTSEIASINRALARMHGLDVDGVGDHVRIVGKVPDGTHRVEFGDPPQVRIVTTVGGKIDGIRKPKPWETDDEVPEAAYVGGVLPDDLDDLE